MAATFKRVQKVCMLWTHDQTITSEDVVVNFDRFQELGLAPGSLAQILAVKQGTAVRDFQDAKGTPIASSPANLPLGANSAQQGLIRQRNRSNSLTTTFDENGVQIPGGRDVEAHRSYIFVAKDASAELKSRYPGLQISVAQTIAHAFGFRNRTQVIVATADEASNSASHVEISFKDEYLSRADMWRLAVAELSQKTVYRDQRILFLGTIKATVKNVWIDGQRKKSGYFNACTKPVFRSESARFVLFIQMSREMWNFDSEGSGEIMFNKVINGFLPELFKNWMSIGARHLVSIVLFSRLEYDEDPDSPWASSSHNWGKSFGNPKRAYRDFYRVVVSDMASNDWIRILWQLKIEFRTFLRDVSIQPVSSENEVLSPAYKIVGKPTVASDGNILEAINLASYQFARDYIDRDLVRTGISVVVVTAGTGVYEVDYALLKLTTDVLMGSGIGIDLVCLSPMPLHSVPLFKYRNPRPTDASIPASPSPSSSIDSEDSTPRQRAPWPRALGDSSKPLQNATSAEWSYAMPYWIDVSFWPGTADEQAVRMRQKKPKRAASTNGKRSEFTLRCRMYELQMMGVMENEMINITVPYVHESPLHPWQKIKPQITGRALSDSDRSRLSKMEREWMEDYDSTIFKPLRQRRAAEEKAREDARNVYAELSSTTSNLRLKLSDSHPGGTSSSYRPGTGYLDWRIKDRAVPMQLIPERKKSLESSASSAEIASISSKASRATRQISFGGFGFATPKADVSTDLSVMAANVRPAILSKDSDTSLALGLSRFTQQFRAALTRTPSQSALARPNTGNTEPEKPSQPINIGATRPLTEHSRSSSGDIDVTAQGEREDAVRSARNSPVKTQEAGAIMYAASNARKLAPRPALARSAIKNSASHKPSPAIALSPWLVLVNPCNPNRNDLDVNSRFRRWQHVFPRQLRTASMKWKSLCSPASVPLTNDYFPTAEQLATEFEESPYRLSQDVDDDTVEVSPSREALIREMIAFRLAHGFQLVVGPAVSEFLGAHTSDLVNIFDKDYMAKEGATVFMSAGNAIHQLLCTSMGEIEVRRFKRKPSTTVDPSTSLTNYAYKSYIRTFLETSYEEKEISFAPPRTDFNWNYIDTFLAGYNDEFSETLRFWRARFVLIPVDIPTQGRRPLSMLAEDSAEESRLEGIRKLTQIWQRHRVIPPEERTYQSTRKRKDPNPLAIEYQTRDASAIVAAGPESALLADTDSAAPTSALFSENETYSTKNVDLRKLAHDLQSERGIKIIDRRWHFRLHYHCFVGFDLTSWLLENFRDIDSREDAVAFGNELMDQGLFQHTMTRHRFRDGQYFYQIASEYRAPRPEARLSWFGTRKGDRSVPPTPMTEAPRTAQTRPETNSSTEQDNEKMPVLKQAGTSRRKVLLSHVMRYDIDPRKRSYRPEIINLHYDRLHNPDNCYHIRIDWMNATAKLIEDAIGQWAWTVEKHGLKLVEVPIAEAAAIGETQPFRSPYRVKLAVPPPPASSIPYFDATAFTPQSLPDRHGYHKLLLKKMQFVLDVEAASCFPADVDVSYSWGKPSYKFTQYIHRSGVILAQIADDGDFLLLANRLYNNRSHVARESGKFDSSVEGQQERPRTGGGPQGHHGHANCSTGALKRLSGSPPPSPTSRPVNEAQTSALTGAGTGKQPTAEEIKDQLVAFCKDVDALNAFYEEARRRQSNPSPSPHLTPTLDSTVPTLKLPANIASIRDSSPSPALGESTNASAKETPPSRASERNSVHSQS